MDMSLHDQITANLRRLSAERGTTPTAVARDAGIISSTLHWTAHPCRHRLASRAYGVEKDLMAVMGVLGHTSPATTRRYIVTDMDARRRAVFGA